MKFSRIWSMPNANTFEIKPIKELLIRVLPENGIIVDPFARDNAFGTITNDLNPDTKAQYHLHAFEFLDLMIEKNIIADAVILDPPYSVRQISECYQNIGRKCTQKDTQNAHLYSVCKDKMTKILKEDGIAVTCGWNSNGFGLKRGFTMEEILLVPCGAAHNDYIVTVERKNKIKSIFNV